MLHRQPPRKKAVNVFLSEDLVADARAMGMNLSEMFEAELSTKVRAERARRWLQENREAIEQHNADVRRNGLWSDEFRPW